MRLCTLVYNFILLCKYVFVKNIQKQMAILKLFPTFLKEFLRIKNDYIMCFNPLCIAFAQTQELWQKMSLSRYICCVKVKVQCFRFSLKVHFTLLFNTHLYFIRLIQELSWVCLLVFFVNLSGQYKDLAKKYRCVL